jgi:ArsR family transcriptional regulator
MMMTTSLEINELSDKLKVIADPKRLLILDLLMQGVQCNCELGGKLNMAPNLISHHLNVLRQAGLIFTQRDTQDARWIYYSINQSAVHQMMNALNGFFDVNRIQPRNPSCGPQKEGTESCREKYTHLAE